MTAPGRGPQPDHPPYGVVDRYLGERGRDYFEPQREIGLRAGEWNRFIFEPHVSTEDEVLDFGCGGGYVLATLRPRVAVGIEINPTARAVAARLGIEVHATLAEVAGRRFTRIVTSHALEHVPSPHQALTALRELLQPGGRLIWLSPMDDWRTSAQRRWRPADPDVHIYAWTPLSMGNLLAAAGFDVRSVRVLTHAWPPSPLREPLWRLSPAAFHAAARVWAVLRRRRQLLAVATPRLP